MKNNIRIYIRDQNGAALLLILFTVVFIGIVGTVMLQNTTYSLKTVSNNKQEQKEFYRAEGALEIFLTEMNDFVNEDGNKGPYFYLLKGENPNNPYMIGSEEIKVTVRHTSKLNRILKPSELLPGDSYTVNVELKAEKKDGSDSRVKRILKFDTTLEIPAGGTENISNNAVNYITDSKKASTYEIPISKKKQLSNTVYNQILSSLGIDWSKFNSYPVINSSYTFPSGISKIKSISISGKNEQIYIPNNSIVIVDSFSVTGKGNSEYSAKVDGVLIARDLFINGNGKFVINSGIITNSISGPSAASKIAGKANGIDCSLLPIACNVPTSGGGSVGSYTTYSNNIDFSKNR